MTQPRRVAIVGGNRIPFARSNTVYATASNQEMLISALDGLVERSERQRSQKEVENTIRDALAAVGLVMAGFIAFFIARSITVPVGQITSAMGSLADNKLDTVVPGLDHRSEIGLMAKAVDVFKQNAIKVRELTAQEAALQEKNADLQSNIAVVVDAAVAGDVLARLRAQHEYLYNCADCKVELGKAAGSQLVAVGWVQSRIRRAEERGDIRPGDTLIEATSGNTGIALAMAAAIKGYRMVLIMPEDLSIERAQTMKAFGAELILTPKSGGMEYARDLAEKMQGEGKGRMLDQFANADNPRIHYETTGPELWEQTGGRITHFVSAMGTTGTITGVSRFLKEKNPAIRIVGAQPSEGSRIPGIRKWPTEYLPKIYDPSHVDELVYVSQGDAEDMCRRLAREEGIFGGISAAGACWVALQIAQQVENATIVFVVCDRGDRYLSTGVFPA